MNRIISTLTFAAASWVVIGGVAQAQLGTERTFVERRVATQTVEEPTVRLAPRTRVLSGETLAGRREVIANDAVIIQDGDEQRALFRRGSDIKTPRVNRFLAPGTQADTDVEIELEVDD